MLTWDLLRCWITSSGEHLMIVCLAYGYSFRTGQWHFSCRNFDPASFPCKNPRCFHSRCCKDNEHDQRAGVPVSEPNVPKTGTFIFMFKLKSWLLKGPMRWHRSLGNNLPNQSKSFLEYNQWRLSLRCFDSFHSQSYLKTSGFSPEKKPSIFFWYQEKISSRYPPEKTNIAGTG